MEHPEQKALSPSLYCTLSTFFFSSSVLIKSEDQYIKSKVCMSHEQSKAIIKDPSVQRCRQVKWKSVQAKMEALTSQHCLLLALSLPKQWKWEGGCVQMQSK